MASAIGEAAGNARTSPGAHTRAGGRGSRQVPRELTLQGTALQRPGRLHTAQRHAASDDARPEGGDNGQPARPGDPIDLQRVLLPVWGSHGVSWGAEIGFSIARGSEMEVDVLHWVSAPRRRLRAGWDDATRHAVEIGEDLVGKVAQFGERLEARVRTGVSVAADPEEAFIEHAKRHPGLIVLESTRSPVRRRAFFGHEVDYLLRHAPCPVALISAPQANQSGVTKPAATE